VIEALSGDIFDPLEVPFAPLQRSAVEKSLSTERLTMVREGEALRDRTHCAIVFRELAEACDDA
jgi:hypothetical protein